MPRPKQPRCKFCGTDKPLPFGEDVCDVCKRVCPGCGRRIPYAGHGGVPTRCPDCREWNGRLCPCGKRIPLWRKALYCSTRCKAEFRRVRSGLEPRDGWRIDMTTVEAVEGDHARAARVVAAWMRLAQGLEVRAEGDSIMLGGSRKFVVRHMVAMAFDGGGLGLPELVPVDDAPRMEALRPWPAKGYLLLNGQMNAAAHVPVDAARTPFLARRRRWVPRYGEFAEFVMAPRRIVKAFSLVVDGVDAWSMAG
jgi:hypothetical protein